ncbi:MAG: histidinol-phosphate transaminase [Oceanospirillaceae bacterium]|uniref:histidinol-phosphate transaminase n=1 Tax=unclassified Thalassolituus TaxID=2624967 RepID=UPI000C4A1621|nr:MULTISPECIES: histidinol-phosphate transaminase [unclassified Thalassolituus]MAS24025.1 histidinol-phosphate transaminase [Oceanospirillaceae bacterium]MBL33816.1 histidinol-phosphate transaminase [Oceanospirillaceae bacterium]MBS51613.1 histidinol-phosphate transaminase [Oceanospirillaceae bacterium]|tara:strand:- start:155 stop:1267 length:1113 start_codon:yes stop_codon:yes gene_type:complete
MAVDFLQLAVPGVQALRPYQPGKPIDELARELGLNESDIVKLASNENPMGPGPKALAAIEASLQDVTLYPDGAGFELKKALCEKLGIKPEQITLGNGSSDILDFIVRVFVNDGDNIVVSQHSFAIYGLVAKMVGADCIQVPAVDFGHDLKAMAAAINERTKIVFITNPNNPTGTWLTRSELVSFLNSVPEHVLVLLDEAYFEFVAEEEYPDGISLLADYPNLVVARTFSKAYGLAALRVGYSVSGPQIADLLNRVRPPFNVNSQALAAAAAALTDDDYVASTLAVNRAGLMQLEAAFKELGLSFIPSVGNFIAFKVPENTDENTVYQSMLQQGVIIRPVGNYDMPGYLRVTVGTEPQNAKFIEALKTVLS